MLHNYAHDIFLGMKFYILLFVGQRVSLNSFIACSFSLLSGDVSSISNARLIISSSAVRHTWYCSGKYSVAYSLMDSGLAAQVLHIRLIDCFETCSSLASLFDSYLLLPSLLLWIYAILVGQILCSKSRNFLRKYYGVQIFSFINIVVEQIIIICLELFPCLQNSQKQDLTISLIGFAAIVRL